MERNIRKYFSGTVVSDKMQKTIVVKVETSKTHPLYNKRYISSKKFKVHDEKNEAKIGDNVRFEECRPLSKQKAFRLVSIKKEAK